MKYICPLITVSDITRSRNFYENLLNQTVKFDFGENITFQGDFSIHLQSHFRNLIDNKEIKTGGNNFELYFEDDNIEEFAGRLRENNIRFLHDVREQPWRQKVIRFYDPDDNIIEIGESMEFLAYRLHKENMAIEKIAEIINMNLDFVKISIKKYSINKKK